MSSKSFPENIIEVLRDYFLESSIEPEGVYLRPLVTADHSEAMGIFATEWKPVDNQIGQWDPVLARYTIKVQILIKHTDEEDGRAASSIAAKNIRVMLYRDNDLRVRLTELFETGNGYTERVQRWGVRGQDFLINEGKGEFMFLASADLWIETETV